MIVAVPFPNPVTSALVPVPKAPPPTTRNTFVSLDVHSIFLSVVFSGVKIAFNVTTSSFEIVNASVLSKASPVAGITCGITFTRATPLN